MILTLLHHPRAEALSDAAAPTPHLKHKNLSHENNRRRHLHPRKGYNNVRAT
ncbi:hypothetical protein BGY98DRAFT_994989 [Russula aff. rugulosa BPL654]|nr:hypothetical protein BGY98DRAFT_994989 [Russula aff. rugulosa BPL654]